MAEDVEPQSGDTEAEEQFLAALSSTPLPVAEMMATLASLHQAGRLAVARNCAGLLQDALIEAHDRTDGIRLLAMRASWHGTDPQATAKCMEIAANILGEDTAGAAFVDSCGFKRGDPAIICVGRLDKMLALGPGVLCHDKTWGLGTVRRVDTFYKRVVVDFEGRPDHELSFEHAAASLQLVGPDHILAIRHRRPDDLAAMIRSDPGEVVRLALRSYGPMNSVRLQELLVPAIVTEQAWKDFWTAARRALKEDPRVELPAKRTDPIMLLSSDKRHDSSWYAKLRAERDVKRLLSMMEELAATRPSPPPAGDDAAILENRMMFAIDGAAEERAAATARCLLVLDALKLQTARIDTAKLRATLLSREGVIAAGENLPARLVSHTLDYLARHDQPALTVALVQALQGMSMHLLGEAVEFLVRTGHENDAAAVFRSAASSRTASVHMVSWLARHMELLGKWSLCDFSLFVQLCVTVLEAHNTGEALRSANALRLMFDQKDWLRGLIDGLDPDQRKALVTLVRESQGWGPAERTSLLARLITLDPSLQNLLVDEKRSDDTVARGRFSSWRSLKEKMARLERLEKVDLPRNARDLAQARSYGDLSENHAFKAAKQEQAMLMHMQDELTLGLREVHGTSFAGFPAETAGMGTTVVLRSTDSMVREYHVLGEWDHDDQLGIISCKSPLGLAVSGHKIGDVVTMSAEHRTEVMRVVGIRPLPELIKRWAEG